MKINELLIRPIERTQKYTDSTKKNKEKTTIEVVDRYKTNQSHLGQHIDIRV